MSPAIQKLVAVVAVFVIVIGGLGAGIYAKTSENAATEAEVQKLADEIKGLDAIIATREAKKKLRSAQDDIFKELVSILPQYTERQDERVLETLTDYATRAKLVPQGIVPTVRGGAGGPPGPGAAAGGFAQTELRIQYTGTFFNFLKFLNLVENHESFLRVDEIQLNPGGAVAPTPGSQAVDPHQIPLQITVKISTFHYVTR